MTKGSGFNHRIYNYIEQHHRTKGYAPSYREIAKACKVPLGTLYHRLDLMEREGMIARTPGALRSIRVLNKTERRFVKQGREYVLR